MVDNIDIRVEPREGAYRALLDAGLSVCDRFLLVVRERSWLSEAGQKVLCALSPSLINEAKRSEWPGTVLLSGQAEVLTYEYTPATLEVLASAVEGLYEWVAPFPEDLCLLSGDDAWLVSIAHERDAYIRVSGARRQDHS